MGQPELDYKRDLVTALIFHSFDMQVHEDKHSNFIPDLSFAHGGVEGWIEVKWCDEPPPTLDSMKHWTAGQEDWLRNRGRAGGGHCYLLVGTPKLHVLWKYGALAEVRRASWTHAVSRATLKEYTLSSLSHAMSESLRRRVPY